MKILIIGGVAGGMSTAARLRRLSENVEIVIIERGKYISYANCGLPYYIGGEIKDRNFLFVQTKDSFEKRFNVKIHINCEALEINRKIKEVKIKNLKTNETFIEKYDKLVLSPGAEPIIPDIKGINNSKVFKIRNVEDTDKIYNFILESQPKKAVVIGGGYIGLEMAENLKNRNIFVTIVEALPQVMNALDFDMAAIIHQHLKQKGIELYLNDGVVSIEESNNKLKIILKSQKEILADFVILSIGVKPEIKLAKDSGLTIGEKGIKVNEYLQTSDPDIYAIGDAIEVKNPIIGKYTYIPLAGPANKQGRIVANNIINGNKENYFGTIGTGILKIFDLTAGLTGLNEKYLSTNKIKYETILIHSNDHAGYYPQPVRITLKLLFSPETGKIYGFQAVGFNGIDKRIDVLAALIQKNGSIYDLKNFEHAYAPPYSSAKDPINMLGFIAENIINGYVRQITYKDLENINENDVFILDVRNKEETLSGIIKNAVNIPLNDLRNRLSDIPKNKKIIVYCAVGLRGYLASRILMQNGFNEVYNLSGGYTTYSIIKQNHENINQFDEAQLAGITKTNLKNINSDVKKIISVDACGLQCPGPILKLKSEIDKINYGDRIEIKASDPGFYNDVMAWARTTGNKLLNIESNKGIITAVIEKDNQTQTTPNAALISNDKTIIVFSGDLDKLIAAFIIANGAAAMGRRVTMFFTFWGLSALKKEKEPKNIKKNFIEKMFGFMLPRGSKKLSLSKMNMAGMGPKMIRYIMKKHNIDSLEELMRKALQEGVKIVACQMTMDLLGIKKEELIDGVEIGGVASYLESAEKADTNLFI
ncbi:MAG: FAD-dependent oxidoreductase [Candidatus Goldbacteria bacterium]|nr:FAD-dependent oxidoreductase [Candidatus Goldiibacteriota bacterium]